MIKPISIYGEEGFVTLTHSGHTDAMKPTSATYRRHHFPPQIALGA